MNSMKLAAGESFPKLQVPKLGRGTLTLGEPKQAFDWQLVIVYRGAHCPLCTRYLNELNQLLPQINELGVDVAVVSADSEEKARQHLQQVNPKYDVGYDLTIEQMQSLGLYISNPRSPEETDRPFAEPGLFVINDEGNIQIIDISNAPFARPELKSILMGLNFIRNPDNKYPVRGTYK